MSDFAKKYPALSLFIPSSILSKQTESLATRSARKHLLSLILLISLFQISTIALSQSPNNHNYLELTEAWKYRWGESPLNEEGVPLWIAEESLSEEWKPITYTKSIFNPPGRNGERELWLCVSLPDTDWERPSVTVDNVSLPCDVYLEDKLIYKYEAVSLLGETKNRLPISHMIPLETEYQDRNLFFRIYPEDASIMGIEGVLCGSQHELTRKIVKENIHLIILGCLFLATGLVSILIFLKRRQEKIHLVFGLFSLCIGIMAIYEARELRQLFFGRSSLADSIFIIVPFFMPGWLCMYFEYLFGSGYKSIIRRLWQIHLIYAILCLSILILNFAPFSALQMHQMLFLIALITMLVLFSTSVFYAIKGKPEARIITTGFAAFFIFGIYDILGGGLLLIRSWSGVTYPWGMLAFIFALGFVLERRFSEAHEQLQEYSKGLETKVAERTQDLNEKNETLEKTLSELKSTQTQLVQAEKMASLGQLTAGVAHEINNPIGAINSNIALNDSCFEKIKKAFEPISEREDLDEIGKLEQLVSILEKNNETSQVACDRIIEIVSSLKSFARLDEAEYQKADIHEGIDSTLTLLSYKFGDRIEVIKNYGNIPLVNCFPNQLNQVFMNIISNAILAIEGEGSITIKTEIQNPNVRVSIKDTGVGIPDEYKERIFEPFFTTREIGEGRGLGLSLSFGIIEKHKGKIEFTSEMNKGSEFVISLPLQQ